MKISLAMIVKNEEKNLRNCLNSVYDKVDEIVIVDTGSKDKTSDIAKEFTDKLYDYKWNDNFSDARNFSLSMCTGDWILVLDADDIFIEGSKGYLYEFAEKNPNKIGLIQRMSNYIQNGEECIAKEYEARFFEKGIYYEGTIHEQLNSKNERTKINIKFNHSGYLDNSKNERNLRFLLKEYENNKEDNYISYQIARTLFVDKKYFEANKHFEVAYKNLNRKYIYTKNLVISYIYNLTNIKEYQKALDVINENNKYYVCSSEFNFACGIFYMNLILSDIELYGEYLYLIENSYLRCLEIGELEEDAVVGLGSFKAAYNLGVFYETTGQIEKAKNYYEISKGDGYKKAIKRLNDIINM